VEIDDFFKSRLWSRFLSDENLTPTPQIETITLEKFPATSISINRNFMIITQNTFTSNYIVIGNGLYVQGTARAQINSNTFTSNFIPMGNVKTWSDFLTTANAYSLFTGKSINVIDLPFQSGMLNNAMGHSSNLIVRLCNNV
jgi:hypothetical protein